MTTWTINLGWTKPPFTLNGSQGMTKRAIMYRARLRREAKHHVWNLVRAEQIPPLSKATLTLVWIAPVKRSRDDDNLAPTCKVISDALVGITWNKIKLPGVLPDDNTDVVTWAKPVIRVQKGHASVHLVIEGVEA